MWDKETCEHEGHENPHHKKHPQHHPLVHCHCPGTGLSRFLQPCLLMLLAQGSSHGYDLVEKLPGVGYLDSTPDPATVYKVLRRLEADGVVKSEWDTSGSGPAKRVYSLTAEGEEMLRAWAVSLRNNKKSVEKFLKVFEKKYGKEKGRYVMCCNDKGKCEHPHKLKGKKPGECTPEQIKECHGDVKGHPCCEKKK